MTRKDYVVIAAILHAERQAAKAENVRVSPDGNNTFTDGIAIAQALRTIERIEASLCDTFKADNPLFDAQRFLLASGGRKAQA